MKSAPLKNAPDATSTPLGTLQLEHFDLEAQPFLYLEHRQDVRPSSS